MYGVNFVLQTNCHVAMARTASLIRVKTGIQQTSFLEFPLQNSKRRNENYPTSLTKVKSLQVHELTLAPSCHMENNLLCRKSHVYKTVVKRSENCATV